MKCQISNRWHAQLGNLSNLESLRDFNNINNHCDISGDENLALLRPATQSTTVSSGYEADKGVDGAIGTTAMTENIETHPWWKVHLARLVWVTRVEIITNSLYSAYIKFL